jgi:microcystin-dependent protein
MSEPFLGQLATFAFNFAPINWMVCEGQTLPIQQYAALFSLVGTQYGGNGTTNFQVPNLQGAVAVGQGNLIGGSTYSMGETGGSNNITLTTGNMPLHNHALNGSIANGTVNTPAGNTLARPAKGAGRDAVFGNIYSPAAPNITLSARSARPCSPPSSPSSDRSSVRSAARCSSTTPPRCACALRWALF